MKQNKILGIALILALSSCNKTETLSSLKVIEKEINFGTISQNDTVVKTFEVLNTSDVPLKISKIGTSCGCTGAIVSDSVVNKGELAKIKATFIPRKGESGAVKNSIVIETNTEEPFTALYMKGNVEIKNF